LKTKVGKTVRYGSSVTNLWMSQAGHVPDCAKETNSVKWAVLGH